MAATGENDALVYDLGKVGDGGGPVLLSRLVGHTDYLHTVRSLPVECGGAFGCITGSEDGGTREFPLGAVI